MECYRKSNFKKYYTANREKIWKEHREERYEKNKEYRVKNKKSYQLIVARSMLKSNGIILCKHCMAKIDKRIEELKEEQKPDKKVVLEEIV